MRRHVLAGLTALVTVVLHDGRLSAQDLIEDGDDRAPRFLLASAGQSVESARVDVDRTPMLRRRISVTLLDVSLEEALKTIAVQSGLDLAYSRTAAPLDRIVRLDARDITVAAALIEVLLDAQVDVVFSRRGRAMLVKRDENPLLQPPMGAVAGRVTDAESAEPIPGVEVFLEGTRWRALTADDGRYRLAAVEAGTYTIVARRIGFGRASRVLAVSADEEATADFTLTRTPTRLEELVTTGTVISTEVRALPTPVTVIDAEDIALHRPRTIQEIFRQAVPGAVSWDNPARPEDKQFSVRGASSFTSGSSQMKVFVDGVEVANPTYAEVAPNSIERIEVIRGPQAAAIYGSDAIGGVIQLFTKRGDPNLKRPQVNTEAALGVIQTPYSGVGGVLRQHYAASVRGGAPGASYNIGGAYSHTDDYLPNGEPSSQSNPSIFGGMRFARDLATVDIFGRYTVQSAPEVVNPEFSETGLAEYSKPFYRPSQYANQAAGLQLGLAPTSWWQHSLKVGIDRFTYEYEQTRPRLTTPEDTLLLAYDAAYTKRSVGYHTSIKGALRSGVSGSLTAGVDHYRAPQTSFTTLAASTTGSLPADATRLVAENTGYFAQGQIDLHESLYITAGIRAERNTEFGDSLGTPVSPQVGLSYVRPVGGTTLKLRGSWGRAIRAPDPANRLSLGPTILPNFRLGPERQRGWDIGIDAVFGERGSLSTTYFDQTAENLIQFVLVEEDIQPLYQFQNVGRVRNTGLEIEGALSVGVVQARATYGYARARVEELGPNYTGDIQVGDQARGKPKHTAGALLAIRPLAGTTLSTGLAYVGPYTQTSLVALLQCLGGTGPCPEDFSFVTEFPSIVKLNATLWQQITPQVSGFVSVENLTNNHDSEGYDVYPVMGRVSTLGFRLEY